MNKYVRFPDFKIKAVTLSYDDGIRQDKRLIDIMKKNGLRGTFNINGGRFSDSFNGETAGVMTREEALDLYIPSGMEVALHGYRHLSLADVPMPLATDEMVTDRRAHEALFDRIIRGMAYANGSYNGEVISMLRSLGVTYARTVKSTEGFSLPSEWLEWHPTCHHNNPRLMDLAREFVEISERGYFWARKLSVFYLWGHSYELDNNDNWQVIEEFAEFIGGREDIWYATNGEICDYMRAAESLVYSIDGKIIENPTAIDIYLNLGDRRVIVPATGSVRV